MRDIDHRQARRVVRNVRESERELFNLVDDLQTAMHLHDDQAHSWGDVLHALEKVQARLSLVKDLVWNVLAADGGHQADDPDSGVDLGKHFKESRTRCPFCSGYCAPGRETCDHPDCIRRKKKSAGPGGSPGP